MKKEPQSLVEKAQSIPMLRRSRIVLTPEQFELALAYCRGDVALRQLAGVLNKNSHPGNANHWLGRILVGAVRNGWLIPGKRPS